MHLGFARPHASLNTLPVEGEIADFVVLSGPNGAGKSQLLEAIQDGALTISGQNGEFITGQYGEANSSIRLFKINSLIVEGPDAASLSSVTEAWVALSNVQRQILNWTDDEANRMGYPKTGDVNSHLRQVLTGQQHYSSELLNQLEGRARKPLADFTAQDFRDTATLYMAADPFSISIVDSFLKYHRRSYDNAVANYEASQGRIPFMTPLSEKEFIARNGQPPWELFNGILSSIGIDYEFNRPTGNEGDLLFSLLMTDTKTGAQVSPSSLSSGEKTLLAIARTLYTATNLRGSIQMPQVLLLDEPDASLHPSMVKTLLTVIEEVFVQEHNVKVILTTHSPTTVALAPEVSLYVMRRNESPKIVKASREKALASLLVGLPTLAVSIDKSKQVFVESTDDEQCYQELFTLLRPIMQPERVLSFIASGSKGKGSNHEVIQLVSGLRDRGNMVLGVIDRDLREEAPPGTVLVANRYSIENLLLDPVAIGLLLLREQKPKSIDLFGEHVPLHEITASRAQQLCDYVVGKVRDYLSPVQLASIDKGTTADVTYDGGVITMPDFVLNYRGHDWEDEILMKAFEALKGPKHDFKGNLKLAVVETIFKEVPRWVPHDIRNLFNDLLAYEHTER